MSDISPGIQPFVTLNERHFAKFSETITRETGIRMPHEKLPMLQSRLQRRLRQLGLDSLEDYQRRLFESPDSALEWVEFINLVTTNKTDFFREPKHFDYLTKNALPSLDRNPNIPWNAHIWCAGCSSGEEPYTLAMVLDDYSQRRPGFDFSLLGTDISTRVLDLAKAAIYDEAVVGPIPPEFRHRYLLRGKDHEHPRFRIAPELRHKVRFGRLNFMDENYGIKDYFDVIFFRNVMIYFEKPVQQLVLSRICQQLKPGGYLFAGHSESLTGLDLPIRQVGASVFRHMR